MNKQPLHGAVGMLDADPVAHVISHNLHRRHLTDSQRIMIAAKARPLYEAQAKERQRASGGDKKSANAKSVMENVPQPIGISARDAAGAALGVSGKTVDDSKCPGGAEPRNSAPPSNPRPWGDASDRGSGGTLAKCDCRDNTKLPDGQKTSSEQRCPAELPAPLQRHGSNPNTKRNKRREIAR